MINLSEPRERDSRPFKELFKEYFSKWFFLLVMLLFSELIIEIIKPMFQNISSNMINAVYGFLFLIIITAFMAIATVKSWPEIRRILDAIYGE